MNTQGRAELRSAHEGLTDTEVAVAAARAGAAVVRDLYGRRLTRIDKGCGDFATSADVCGTRNYAAGSMLVAVNVALRGGAAAVSDPLSGHTICTDGQAARVLHEGAEATALPSAVTALVDVNLDPPFPSAPGFRATALLAHPGFGERFRPRVLSTTLALAWVACGKRAAYVMSPSARRGCRHRASLGGPLLPARPGCPDRSAR